MVVASDALSQPWLGLSLSAFPSIPLLEDKDHGGSGRGSNSLHCQLAEQVQVLTPPDGMQDSSPAPIQDGSTVAMSA